MRSALKGAADLDAPTRRAVLELARSLGQEGPWRATPIRAGWNNRVYRIDAAARPLLLKVYFRNAKDQRDRLRSEFAFLDFATRVGLDCVPKPLASDPKRGLGLLEYVDGRKLAPGEVTSVHVREAMAFYRTLNAPGSRRRARPLAAASEACFSVADHLNTVGRRLQRLQALKPGSGIDRAALRFIQGDLKAAWTTVEQTVKTGMKSLRWALDRPLQASERRVSPSDFGFHNALVRPRGAGLCFIDFEYAGWDDPAKMVCDFFHQPAVRVPVTCLAPVLQAAVEGLPDPARHRERMRLLMPVYGLKWCCIVLNEFLATGRSRRRFARESGGTEARKVRQLALSKSLLERVESADN